MKKIIGLNICFFAICGTLCCFFITPGKEVDNRLPNVVIAQNNNQAVNSYPDNKKIIPQEIKKIVDLTDSVQLSEKEALNIERRRNQEIYNQAKILARESHLIDLQNTELPDSDKEIRVWNIPDLYSPMTKGYIFKSVGGIWHGMFIFDKNNKQNFKQINFETPKSGWENWEMFVDSQLSPTKIKIADSNSQSGNKDGMLVVIEVKFGRQYAKNIFYDSTSEAPLLGGIYGKIKEEFYNDKLNWKDY